MAVSPAPQCATAAPSEPEGPASHPARSLAALQRCRARPKRFFMYRRCHALEPRLQELKKREPVPAFVSGRPRRTLTTVNESARRPTQARETTPETAPASDAIVLSMPWRKRAFVGQTRVLHPMHKRCPLRSGNRHRSRRLVSWTAKPVSGGTRCRAKQAMPLQGSHHQFRRRCCQPMLAGCPPTPASTRRAVFLAVRTTSSCRCKCNDTGRHTGLAIPSQQRHALR